MFYTEAREILGQQCAMFGCETTAPLELDGPYDLTSSWNAYSFLVKRGDVERIVRASPATTATPHAFAMVCKMACEDLCREFFGKGGLRSAREVQVNCVLSGQRAGKSQMMSNPPTPLPGYWAELLEERSDVAEEFEKQLVTPLTVEDLARIANEIAVTGYRSVPLRCEHWFTLNTGSFDAYRLIVTDEELETLTESAWRERVRVGAEMLRPATPAVAIDRIAAAHVAGDLSLAQALDALSEPRIPGVPIRCGGCGDYRHAEPGSQCPRCRTIYLKRREPPQPTHCACGAELRTTRSAKYWNPNWCGDCLRQLNYRGGNADAQPLPSRIAAAQPEPSPVDQPWEAWSSATWES